VLDPDLDKYRKMDPRVIVGVAVDTIAGGIPDDIRADYLACYDGDRFAESMRYVRRYPKELPALELYAPLRQGGNVEIRVHRKVPYSFIYRADDQLLVAQRAYAILAEHAPVLHLQRTHDGNMFTAYMESFERTWAEAHPC
jgi:hypothetical protein